VKFQLHLLAFAGTALFVASAAGQTTLYYDTNGVSDGTSTTSSQNLTDAVWSTDPLGQLAPGAYAANNDLVFSAGTNGTGARAIALLGTQSVDGLTFKNGTVTVTGGSSSTLNIGAGGLTMSSADGAATLTGITSTVLSANQQWNNNSTQALNEAGAVNLNGKTLTLAGTGSGTVTLSGVISGSSNSIVDNSATSKVYLSNASNTFTGGITINGGALTAVRRASLGSGSNGITLSNGGIISMDNSEGFSAWTNNITLGTGGGSVYAGDYGVGGIDVVYSGVVTGGTGLTLLGGDFITTTNYNSNVGTFYLNAGRALIGSGGIFANNALINVASGGILDFGWTGYGGTLNNTINLASGSLLENRGPGMTFNNVVLPTSGTLTIGSDDVGGGSITINDGVALTGTLTLDINGKGGGTPVTISGGISGNSGLAIAAGPTGSSTLKLSGTNTYSGPTTLNGVTVLPYVSGFSTSDVSMTSAGVGLTGGTLANNFTATSGTNTFTMQSGATDQVLSGALTMPVGGGFFNFVDNTAGNLTIGNITALDGSGADRGIGLQAYGSGAITLNGTISAPDTHSAVFLTLGLLSLNSAGVYNIGPNANLSNVNVSNYDGRQSIEFWSGTLNIQNSNFVAGQMIGPSGSPDYTHNINIVGAQTISARLYSSLKNGGTRASDNVSIYGEVGLTQSTADVGTWSGGLSEDGTSYTFTAVAGSRLVLSGKIDGGASIGPIFQGPGTIVVSAANTFVPTDGNGNIQPTTQYNAELKPGSTVLIANTTGSAFGLTTFNAGNFYGNGGNNLRAFPVKIDEGATLGGSGITTQLIYAVGAGSIIAPGDPGNSSLGIAPQFQTLHLNGGLNAPNGVTLDFTLNGLSYDSIDFGSSTFSLDNVVTFNLTGTPVISAANNNGMYKLLTGLDLNDATVGPNLDFVFNAPAGYQVVDWEPMAGPAGTFNQDYIEVQLALAPEPSTFGLMGLGLLALVALRRCRQVDS